MWVKIEDYQEIGRKKKKKKKNGRGEFPRPSPELLLVGKGRSMCEIVRVIGPIMQGMCFALQEFLDVVERCP